jgi:hypothetical protein
MKRRAFARSASNGKIGRRTAFVKCDKFQTETLLTRLLLSTANDTDAAVSVAITVAAEAATEAAKQEDNENDNENEAKRHDQFPNGAVVKAPYRGESCTIWLFPLLQFGLRFVNVFTFITLLLGIAGIAAGILTLQRYAVARLFGIGFCAIGLLFQLYGIINIIRSGYASRLSVATWIVIPVYVAIYVFLPIRVHYVALLQVKHGCGRLGALLMVHSTARRH